MRQLRELLMPSHLLINYCCSRTSQRSAKPNTEYSFLATRPGWCIPHSIATYRGHTSVSLAISTASCGALMVLHTPGQFGQSPKVWQLTPCPSTTALSVLRGMREISSARLETLRCLPRHLPGWMCSYSTSTTVDLMRYVFL